MDTKLAIETILKANEKDLIEGFEASGKAAQGLGRKISKVMEEGESKFHKFKEGFKEAFSFGTAATLGAKAGDFIFDKIKEAANALPEFAEKADAIGKSAQKVGLGAEAFQELSYAAKLADVPTDQLSGSLQKLNKGMGEMSKGQGSLFEGLKRVNPQLMNQLRHTTDSREAFIDIAEAVKNASTAQQRAAIATAAFGKSGQELMPMLLGGREELEALIKESHIYGDVIGGEAIQASTEFNDNLTRMKTTLTGIKDQALSGLVVGMAPIIDSMTKWLGQNREFISSGIQNVMKIFGGILQSIGPALQKIIETALPALADAVTKLGPIFGDVFGLAADLLTNLMPLLDPVVSVLTSLGPILQLAGVILKVVIGMISGPLKMAIEAVGYMINLNLMIWSQTIGRLIELVLRGASAVMGALGQDTTGVNAIADSLVQMREQSTNSVLGKKEAPNSGQTALAGSVQVHVPVTINNERAPGVKSTVQAAPALSGFSQGANH